ncbi:hypothetical protein KI688_003655 [Linnemannia hyalina]|uniref:C2H2-type domain-containing protein n=1 Tax=Linnemannia hyalina TaxID=64524 RepID=A0A9P8BQJ7_9FUNG|nr:hypothetical protein KI688_003655 [Linnemannia hyalina]
MSRYAASQAPRLQSGPGVGIDTLSSSVATFYHDALPWSPQFLSLQEALQVVCLNHARGKVSDADLPQNYRGPSFTPVKSTEARFCCITGVAFQDEGNGPETYGYVVEKGDLSYVLQPEPTDTNPPVDRPKAIKTYEVCVKANSKTQYLVRPNDLPSPEDCPKSCRELYGRAVGSVYGKQTPVPLITQSPLPQPPTASTILHGDEFCRPLDNTITTVSCRVPRFIGLDFGVKQIQDFVVVEFSLISGEWQEDDRHYSIPVSVDDQCYPLNVAHLSYTIFSLRGSVLSSYWASGIASNVPGEPASLSCKNDDSHAPALHKDLSRLPTSDKKRPRTDVQQAQRRKKDPQETTPPSTKNRKVLPRDLNPSPPPSAGINCDLCHKAFASRKSLNAHMPSHDENRPSFACDACDKTFTRPSDMDRHKVSSHNNMKCPCEHCGRLLSRADGLLSHQRTCRSKPQ